MLSHKSYTNLFFYSDLRDLTVNVFVTGRGGFSSMSIIEKIQRATNSLSKIVIDPEKRTSFTISIEKAKKEFQYIPWDVEKTLDAYIQECMTNLTQSELKSEN